MRRGVAKKLLVALSVLSGGLCFPREDILVFHDKFCTKWISLNYLLSLADLKLRGHFIMQYPVASKSSKLFTLRSVSAVSWCLAQLAKSDDIECKYSTFWVNGAMDNGSNCLLVQNVAGTERIGLSHSKVAWLMVQEILDNGSILFLFSTSKLYIFSHWCSH